MANKFSVLFLKNRKFLSDINHFGEREGYTHLSAEMPLVCAYLRDKQYNIDVTDYLSIADITPIDKEYGLIVCWISTQGYEECINELNSIINQCHNKPDVAIVLNDTYGKLDSIIMKKFPYIDYVIKRYHRELVIENLINSLENNSQNFNEISGLVYRDSSGKINDAGDHKLLKDISHLVSSQSVLSELELEKYDDYYLIAGYGCNYPCNFCLVGKTRPTYRKVECLIDELSQLCQAKSNPTVHFLGFNLFWDKNWIYELSDKIIDNRLKINWRLDVRIDFVDMKKDSELLEKMRKAGCYAIIVGAETYDPNTMKNNNKLYSIEGLVDLSEKLANKGFTVIHQMLLGMPYDTNCSLFRTYKTLNNMSVNIAHNFQFVRPFNGTEVRNQFEKDGVIPKGMDEYDLDLIKMPFSKPTNNTLYFDIKEIEFWMSFFNLECSLRTYRKNLKKNKFNLRWILRTGMFLLRSIAKPFYLMKVYLMLISGK